jgi:hypothetical protein
MVSRDTITWMRERGSLVCSASTVANEVAMVVTRSIPNIIGFAHCGVWLQWGSQHPDDEVAMMVARSMADAICREAIRPNVGASDLARQVQVSMTDRLTG